MGTLKVLAKVAVVGLVAGGLGLVVGRLNTRHGWAVHNLIGHPMSELVYCWTGSEVLAADVHDATLPTHARATHAHGEGHAEV